VRVLRDRPAARAEPARRRPDILDEIVKQEPIRESGLVLVRVFDMRLGPAGPLFFDGFYREFDTDVSDWRDGKLMDMTVYRAAQPLCFPLGRGALPDEPCRRERWRVYRWRGEWFACVEHASLPPPLPAKIDIRIKVALAFGLGVWAVLGAAYLF
jgi:hypothetical protein